MRTKRKMTFKPPISHPFQTLEEYISACKDNYNACISSLEHSYVVDEGIEATLRFHYIKFDGNNEPKFKSLVEVLLDHITCFCFSAQKRSDAKTEQQKNRLYREAITLLRRVVDNKAGDIGELLIYFLLEAVLEAPQIVCKMDLKTNRKDEVKGADGIHIKWDSTNECLNVFLCESKLYDDYGSALKNALESIADLYTERRVKRELQLVTSHFKYLNDELKKEVSEYIDDSKSKGNCKTIHTCLIGFDWYSYKQLNDPQKRQQFVQEFETVYHKFGSTLQSKTNTLLKDFEYNQLTFEFFFIPFRSVQELRDEFLKQSQGE